MAWSQVLAVVADAVGLGTFAASSYAAVSLWRLERRRRRAAVARAEASSRRFQDQVESLEGVQTAVPWALAVSLLPDVSNESIELAVGDYLSDAGLKMPIRTIRMDGVDGSVGMVTFNQLLDLARQELDAKGATEVHVFFAGPTAAALLISAKLKNWRNLKVYHRQGHSYVYWYAIA